MIVVDASVVVEVLLASAAGDRALGITAERGGEVHVAAHTSLEVLSALRRLLRSGHLSAARAGAAVSDLQVLPAVVHDLSAVISRVWDLRENVTPYDASYLAIAEGLGVPLITRDERLARSSGHQVEVIAV